MKTKVCSVALLLAISLCGATKILAQGAKDETKSKNETIQQEKKKTMEKKFEKIDPEKLQENVINLIANDWMLISSGNKEKFNMMTASWGTIGNLWNKPVAIIYVRPQRYTHEFLEQNEYFTLTFFPEEYKKALEICGSISGKDHDKVKESGLTPYFREENLPAFEEARIIIECRKIYSDEIKPEKFVNKDIDSKIYPQKDYHTMYIGEILNVWIETK